MSNDPKFSAQNGVPAKTQVDARVAELKSIPIEELANIAVAGWSMARFSIDISADKAEVGQLREREYWAVQDELVGVLGLRAITPNGKRVSLAQAVTHLGSAQTPAVTEAIARLAVDAEFRTRRVEGLAEQYGGAENVPWYSPATEQAIVAARLELGAPPMLGLASRHGTVFDHHRQQLPSIEI